MDNTEIKCLTIYINTLREMKKEAMHKLFSYGESPLEDEKAVEKYVALCAAVTALEQRRAEMEREGSDDGDHDN